MDVAPADIYVDSDRLYVSANTLYNSREDFKSAVSVYDVNTDQKIRDLGFGQGNYAEFTNILSIQDASGSDRCLDYVGGIDRYCDDEVDVLHETIDYKQSNWLLPGTSVAINNAQTLLDIETFTEVGALQPYSPSGFAISDISVDSSNSFLVIGYNGISYDDGGLIRYFELSSLEFLTEQYRGAFSDWIFTKDNKVIEIARHGNYNYKLNIIDYPSFTAVPQIFTETGAGGVVSRPAALEAPHAIATVTLGVRTN